MKIFPLKPMSNYDRFQNIMKIIGDTKHINVCKAPEMNGYGINVGANSKHFMKEYFLTRLLSKYKPAVEEIVSKLKRNHCE